MVRFYLNGTKITEEKKKKSTDERTEKKKLDLKTFAADVSLPSSRMHWVNTFVDKIHERIHEIVFRSMTQFLLNNNNEMPRHTQYSVVTLKAEKFCVANA